MTDPKRPIPPALTPHVFPAGRTGNPGGRPVKPAWLAEAAEESMAWMRLVVTGSPNDAALQALSAALEEAWLLGRNNDSGEPQTKWDVKALVEKHWKAIMLARVSEKADLVRLRAAMDLCDRYYGKAQQSVEHSGEIANLVTRVERVIVDPAKPVLGEKKES